MGCRSTADLLLGAGGVEWVEGRAEGGGAAECIGIVVVVGFLGAVI